MQTGARGRGGAWSWDPNVAREVTSEGEGVCCRVQNTGQRRKQAGREEANTRLQGKHSNLRRGGTNTGVLATQASQQDTKAKAQRRQDANNHAE